MLFRHLMKSSAECINPHSIINYSKIFIMNIIANTWQEIVICVYVTSLNRHSN